MYLLNQSLAFMGALNSFKRSPSIPGTPKSLRSWSVDNSCYRLFEFFLLVIGFICSGIQQRNGLNLGVKVQWTKTNKWNGTSIDTYVFKEIGPSCGLKM
uniref:Uncharacterized protein n=1 Tax=Tanacetum cinerariifolium TaxID=118510 RepID=A0A6L2M947_TANCI|nr:hypothetical protein [Tanacetum cinerariifolium]